jgi:hypothetical protein
MSLKRTFSIPMQEIVPRARPMAKDSSASGLSQLPTFPVEAAIQTPVINVL